MSAQICCFTRFEITNGNGEENRKGRVKFIDIAACVQNYCDIWGMRVFIFHPDRIRDIFHFLKYRLCKKN